MIPDNDTSKAQGLDLWKNGERETTLPLNCGMDAMRWIKRRKNASGCVQPNGFFEVRHWSRRDPLPTLGRYALEILRSDYEIIIAKTCDTVLLSPLS